MKIRQPIISSLLGTMMTSYSGKYNVKEATDVRSEWGNFKGSGTIN
jgi:hypothetical protein